MFGDLLWCLGVGGEGRGCEYGCCRGVGVETGARIWEVCGVLIYLVWFGRVGLLVVMDSED